MKIVKEIRHFPRISRKVCLYRFVGAYGLTKDLFNKFMTAWKEADLPTVDLGGGVRDIYVEEIIDNLDKIKTLKLHYTVRNKILEVVEAINSKTRAW